MPFHCLVSYIAIILSIRYALVFSQPISALYLSQSILYYILFVTFQICNLFIRLISCHSLYKVLAQLISHYRVSLTYINPSVITEYRQLK